MPPSTTTIRIDVPRTGTPRSARGLAPADLGALCDHARSLLARDRPSAAGWWRLADGTWRLARFDKVGVTAPHVAVSLEPAEPPHGLSARELDVLTLLCLGMTNPQIAAELRTSARTVATQVASVLAKLGHATRAGAVACAIEERTFRLPIPLRRPPDPPPLSPVDAGPTPRVPVRPARPAPLRIGSIVPGRGAFASDGRAMRRGAALAIAELNARGGVAGRTVDHVVVEVDVFEPGSAAAAFLQLAAQDVDAITSCYFLGADDERLWDVLAGIDVPVLHAMTSRRWVDRVADQPARYANLFHVCPPEDRYVDGMIAALRDLAGGAGWSPRGRTLAVLGSGRASGSVVPDGTAADRLEHDGWRVERWAGALSSPTLLDRLEDVRPAVALVCEHDPAQIAVFQRALASRRLPTLTYHVYTPSMPGYLRQAGRAAEGALWATVTGTYGDALGAGFARRYHQAFGESPGRSHGGIAYDEVSMLAAAWAAVGNARDTRAVVRRLRETPFRGVNGSYYFDHPGQQGLAWPYDTGDASLGQAHLVLQVQDGRHRIIAPDPYAEAAFRPPPWLADTSSD